MKIPVKIFLHILLLTLSFAIANKLTAQEKGTTYVYFYAADEYMNKNVIYTKVVFVEGIPFSKTWHDKNNNGIDDDLEEFNKSIDNYKQRIASAAKKKYNITVPLNSIKPIYSEFQTKEELERERLGKIDYHKRTSSYSIIELNDF